MANLVFEKHEDPQALRVSFVPMIDVVLQIICFYLFVSAGVQAYQDTRVELPVMQADALAAELPAELTINLGADNTLDVNGQPIELAELPARLLNVKARAAADEQRLVVAIRADRRQRFAMLDQVLQACREADLPTVTIRAMSSAARSGGGS